MSDPVPFALDRLLAVRADHLAASAAAEAVERLAESEFATYSCGARLPADLASLPAPEGTAFRRAVRAGIATRLAAAWPHRALVERAADVAVESLSVGGAKLRIAPVFVAGRYCKLARGISQTTFHCRECRGRRRRLECAACQGTGRRVAESVQDFVCRPLRTALGGRSAAFHGSGREDVDVRMLGTGRPFCVTVDRPRVRTFDAPSIEAAVAESSGGRVLIRELRAVPRRAVAGIAGDHGEKTYRLAARPVDGALPPDAVERTVSLVDLRLEQRTPHRVAERRADLVRIRRVSVRAAEVDRGDLVVTLHTDPGTYVKEFVSGDDGRTVPSLSSVLGVGLLCAELDVLDVAGSVANSVALEPSRNPGTTQTPHGEADLL